MKRLIRFAMECVAVALITMSFGFRSNSIREVANSKLAWLFGGLGCHGCSDCVVESDCSTANCPSSCGTRLVSELEFCHEGPYIGECYGNPAKHYCGYTNPCDCIPNGGGYVCMNTTPYTDLFAFTVIEPCGWS